MYHLLYTKNRERVTEDFPFEYTGRRITKEQLPIYGIYGILMGWCVIQYLKILFHFFIVYFAECLEINVVSFSI